MRKIVAICLVFVMLALFVACDTGDGDETTLNPSMSVYTPVGNSELSGSTTTLPTTTQAQSVTYILTTSPDKTAPWYATTRFDINQVSTTRINQQGQPTSATNPYQIIVPSGNQNYQRPSANVSALPSNNNQQGNNQGGNNNQGNNNQGNNNSSSTTTTKPTTTAKPQPVAVDVIINDVYVDSSGLLCATIDSSNWGALIKSVSQKVPVVVDGVTLEKPVTLKIYSNKNPDGNQYVSLDIASLGIDPGSSTVSFTIPQGFLQTIAGNKYNNAIQVSN